MQTNKSPIKDVLMKNKTTKEMRRDNLNNVDWKVLCLINRPFKNEGLIKNN